MKRYYKTRYYKPARLAGEIIIILIFFFLVMVKHRNPLILCIYELLIQMPIPACMRKGI